MTTHQGVGFSYDELRDPPSQGKSDSVINEKDVWLPNRDEVYEIVQDIGWDCIYDAFVGELWMKDQFGNWGLWKDKESDFVSEISIHDWRNSIKFPGEGLRPAIDSRRRNSLYHLLRGAPQVRTNILDEVGEIEFEGETNVRECILALSLIHKRVVGAYPPYPLLVVPSYKTLMAMVPESLHKSFPSLITQVSTRGLKRGSISTKMGQSNAPKKPTIVLQGDLTPEVESSGLIVYIEEPLYSAEEAWARAWALIQSDATIHIEPDATDVVTHDKASPMANEALDFLAQMYAETIWQAFEDGTIPSGELQTHQIHYRLGLDVKEEEEFKDFTKRVSSGASSRIIAYTSEYLINEYGLVNKFRRAGGRTKKKVWAYEKEGEE